MLPAATLVVTRPGFSPLLMATGQACEPKLHGECAGGLPAGCMVHQSTPSPSQAAHVRPPSGLNFFTHSGYHNRAFADMLSRYIPPQQACMQHTLLCIDDEPSICALHKLLFEVNGYRVLVANSGPEGLRLLEGDHVDLVVLDYRMPEMTGDKVAAIIRSKHPEIPILMESAYTDLPKEVLKNVDAYLVKGDATEKLVAQVKALLKKRANGNKQ